MTAEKKGPRTVSLADEEGVKQVLVQTVFGLWEMVNNLTRLRPSKREQYRVTIFGSARAQPGTYAYTEVRRVAAALAGMGCDILTGGGPGLMQAANEGASEANAPERNRSVGIRVDLPFEQDANPFVEQAFEHQTFFTRLHHFVLASDAFVVVPGGIGTVLEAMMVWQLLQVRHLHDTPPLCRQDVGRAGGVGQGVPAHDPAPVSQPRGRGDPSLPEHGRGGHRPDRRASREMVATADEVIALLEESRRPPWWRESMKPLVEMLCLALVLVLSALPGRAGDPPPGQPDGPAANKPAILSAKPLKIDPRDDPLRKLLKERFNYALAEIEARYHRCLAGTGTDEVLFEAAQRLLQAGLEVADTAEARLKLREQYLELAREVERIIALKVEAGKEQIAELERARYFRADAEIQVLREKAKAKAGKEK
jgi:uncharacterized protein (TIGR00725 family)